MRWLLTAAVLTGLILADGGMVAPEGFEVMELGQTAVIRHFDGIEELTLATGFQAYSGFAWIIPVPSRPEVDSAGANLFGELYAYTRPFVRGGGLGCGGMEPGFGQGRDELGRAVEELEAGVIGDWDWTLFRATAADTLARYLDSLGYYLPAGAGAAFEHYVKKGWHYFVVCRVREGTQEYYSGYVGIRLTFASDSIVYPLHISRISSAAVPVTLYVLAEHRQMFDRARLKFSGRVNPVTFPRLPGFVERESHLTKLYRWYEIEEMEDICLRRAPDDREYRDIEYYGANDGGLLLFGAFAAVLLVRRRRRG